MGVKNDSAAPPAALIRAAFDWFESLFLTNKKTPHWGAFLLVRMTGLEKIMVLPPSSRRQVPVHRTGTFDRFESLSLTNKQREACASLSLLVRMTGLEPARSRVGT